MKMYYSPPSSFRQDVHSFSLSNSSTNGTQQGLSTHKLATSLSFEQQECERKNGLQREAVQSSQALARTRETALSPKNWFNGTIPRIGRRTVRDSTGAKKRGLKNEDYLLGLTFVRLNLLGSKGGGEGVWWQRVPVEGFRFARVGRKRFGQHLWCRFRVDRVGQEQEQGRKKRSKGR